MSVVTDSLALPRAFLTFSPFRWKASASLLVCTGCGRTARTLLTGLFASGSCLLTRSPTRYPYQSPTPNICSRAHSHALPTQAHWRTHAFVRHARARSTTGRAITASTTSTRRPTQTRTTPPAAFSTRTWAGCSSRSTRFVAKSTIYVHPKHSPCPSTTLIRRRFPTRTPGRGGCWSPP